MTAPIHYEVHDCAFYLIDKPPSPLGNAVDVVLSTRYHSHCVVAHNTVGTIVGYHQCTIDSWTDWYRDDGAFVDRHYRRRGIATTMWHLALSIYNPRRVEVEIISPGGHRMIQRVQQSFPRVKWNVLLHRTAMPAPSRARMTA